MPTIKIRPLGVSGGTAGHNGGEYGERQQISGWSLQSARGNTQFLRSIVVEELPEFGLAFTLTVRDVPSPQEWAKLRKRLARRLTRDLGCVCWHVVTEWTKAGRPHLHGVAFWLEFDLVLRRKVLQWWLKNTKHLGTDDRAQLVKPIDVAEGWFIYMGKHASRGMAHYQRQADALPDEWKSNTGRVWSHGGLWPTSVEENEVSEAEFFTYRRCIDRYAISQAKVDLRRALNFRKEAEIKGVKKRIVFLKRLRKAFGAGRTASSCRGLNMWVPQRVSSPLLRLASSESEIHVETRELFLRALADHGLCEEDVPF